MPGVELALSPEGIVDVIALTEADLKADSGQPALSTSQHQAFVQAVETGRPRAAIDSNSDLSDDDRQAIRSQLEETHLGFKSWVDGEFHDTDARIRELAKVIFDRAKAIRVDAAKYVEAFQRRLLQGLIKSYLLGPIPVTLASGASSLEANQISVQTTVTLSPSLTVSDPGALAEMLVSLFDVAIALSIQYGPPSK